MWVSNRGLGGLALIALATACSTNPAPRGWLAPAPIAVSDPYGAWVHITTPSAGKQVPSGGELIAVGLDSVFVLTPDGEFHAIARADVTRARVAYYDSQYGQLAAWTTMGSLATLSHGWFLVFSLPVWTIGRRACRPSWTGSACGPNCGADLAALSSRAPTGHHERTPQHHTARFTSGFVMSATTTRERGVP
jgi:hypothetical protein